MLADGHDTLQAERLLAVMQDVLASLEQRRDQIADELRGKGPAGVS